MMGIMLTNMTNLRSNLADALDQVAEGDIVLIKRRGQSNAALIDEGLLEDFMAATNPRIIKKIVSARAEVASGQTVPFDEIFQDVMAA